MTPHPEQPHGQFVRHGDLGNRMIAPHRQVRVLAAPVILEASCAHADWPSR